MKSLFCFLAIALFAFLVSPPTITADENPPGIDQTITAQGAKVLTTDDYQEMVDQLEVGEPIDFYIPISEKVKLRGVCCEPPESMCKNYCCRRC